MKVLDRVEAAQVAELARLRTMAAELPALLEVVSSSCEYELTKLARSRPSLVAWVEGAVAVLSQLTPLRGALVGITQDGVPAMAAGFGLDPSLAGAAIDGEPVGEASVRFADGGVLVVDGLGELLRDSGLVERVGARLASDLPRVVADERAARARAPRMAREAIEALSDPGDPDLLDAITAALALLPGATGAEIVLDAPALGAFVTSRQGSLRGSVRTERHLEVDGGHVTVALISMRPVPSDAAVELDALVDVLREVLDESIASQRSQESDEADPLTGLGDRRYLARAIGRAARRADRFGDPVGVVVLVVDGLDELDDARRGDMIQRSAAALRAAAPNLVVGSPGGGRLAAVLPGADGLEARSVAESLRSRVMRAVRPRGLSARTVTCSAGISVLPTDAHAAEGLLLAADRALDTAIRAGGNQVGSAPAPTAASRGR